MSWRAEWKAISDQIQGLIDGGRFYLECLRIQNSDPHGIARKRIMPHAKAIYDAVKNYRERYELVLPSPAKNCLDSFFKGDSFNKLFSTAELMTAQSQSTDVQARLTLLASLQSELTYHLSDFSALAKRLSERAFLHLQRSIMADSSVKQRWIEAFEKGEVACEKLGGAHLLLHGI